MKKTISQISLIILIIMIGMTSIFIPIVQASSIAGVAVSAAVEGGTFTVGLILPSSAVGAQANITVTYSDGTSSSQSLVYATGMESLGFSNSVDFSAKVAGTTKITVTNIVLSDADGKTIETGGTKDEVMTIQSKTPAPTPTPEPTPTPSTGTQNTTSSVNNTNTSNTTTTNSTVDDKVVNPTFKDVKETVYALKSCNVRSSCSTAISSNKIGGLVVGQSVIRTGTSSEWSRITFDGKTAYVASNLLTTEELEKEENEVTNETNTTEANTVENEVSQGTEVSQEEMLKTIENEVGVLPEVGNNMAVSMFYVLSAIAVVAVIYVNYKSRNKNI